MESMTRLRKWVLVGLVLVPLVLSLPIAWYTGEWGGLALNLCTELIGAGVTYGLLELFIGRRERREAKKADLIVQMGSSVKDVAVAAADELRRHGWLTDGLLRGANLKGANLEGANLSSANLQGANLEGANLEGANLEGANLSMANLQGALLQGANLEGACLSMANLQGALLQEANLEGANLLWANLEKTFLVTANLEAAFLYGANLQGVRLEGADLEGADLEGANLREDTTLPNGTKWTPDTDMARFTDPKHPDSWRPDAPWF